jgi:phytoene dehydrogenase-like protein
VEKPDRLWSKKGPEGPWDTIVIGSGMGGMSAAAMLARFGQRVLVLEQHFVPGGFTQTFRRGRYQWDIGVHAVGEVTSSTPTGRLLDDLARGQLQWAPLGNPYDRFHFPGDFEVDFPDNEEEFRSTLSAVEPSATKAVDAYVQRARSDANAMRAFFQARVLPASVGGIVERLVARRARRAIDQTTKAVLDSTIPSERLRQILTAQWGYYGATPSRASWSMHASMVRHFLDGGWYPAGGAGELARALLGTVAESGGWTRVSSPVNEILISGGKAVGVKLDDGEMIRASRVISAVGVGATIRRLLPEPHRSAPWAQEVLALPPGPAHVSMHLGFRGDIRAAGATTANEWFYGTWDMEVAGWRIDDPGGLPDSPILYVSFPSLKNPRHDPGPDQQHTGEVVTFVPWKAFEPWQGTHWMHRGQDYDDLKERLTERLLAQLERNMPALSPLIDRVELSTPLSTDYFTRAVGGSIYGLEPTPARFHCRWLRPRSPVAGLFFAGSEVGTVGVMGAMYGGMLAATAVAPRRALPYLRKLGA